MVAPLNIYGGRNPAAGAGAGTVEGAGRAVQAVNPAPPRSDGTPSASFAWLALVLTLVVARVLWEAAE